MLSTQEQPLQHDPTLQSDLGDPDLDEAYLHDFFVVMAICNTVVVGSHVAGGREGEGARDRPIMYEAESPDEAALVEVRKSL